MTFLPIVERELRVAAHSPATRRNRTLVTGLVLAVALFMMLFGAGGAGAARIGPSMFWTLSWFALLYCLLEGVRKTADCLSEEKREGTLGLLFLTDLHGYDIVLGKLAANSLNSFYGLFSILPVLALPILVGGVTINEYWRMVLALTNVLFFSLCVGLLVSCWSREEQTAMGWTFLLVLIFAVLPAFAWFHVPAICGPTYAFHQAFAANYAGDAREYWQSLGTSHALSWLCLGLASVTVSYSWQNNGRSSRSGRGGQFWKFLRAGNRTGRRAQTNRRLEENPILWLAMQSEGASVLIWSVVVITAVCAAACLLLPKYDLISAFIGYAVIINLAVKLRLAGQACRFTAAAKRNNLLEMLLVAPVAVNQIVRGYTTALRRIFLPPVIALVAIEIITPTIWFLRKNPAAGISREIGGLVFLASVYLTIFSLDMVAVALTGLWYGLVCEKENQAVAKTVFYVLVIPFFSLIVICVGLPLFFVIPVVWIIQSDQRLHSKLRLTAAQRYGLDQNSLPPLRSLPAAPPKKPPII